MSERIARHCAIQVDLDGRWVIERLMEPARERPIDPDPVFEKGLERLLAVFDEFRIKATFFVVARDLASGAKSAMIRSLAPAGHEIASHGLSHAYLSGLATDDLRREISESRSIIERACGVRVSGFKAPGFAAAAAMVPYLEEAGYLYDSSVLATPLAFLMEAVSRVRYPKWSMCFAPSYPYIPDRSDLFVRGESSIVEMPVSTLPLLRSPAHFSYSLAGGAAYHGVVRAAFAGALRPDVVTYLFHPLDLVSAAEAGLGGRIGGLTLPVENKVSMARGILKTLADGYAFAGTGELAREIMRRSRASS